MNGAAVLSLAPLVFAWIWTWAHLAAEWSAQPQYEYGWGVPLLFAVLAWQQWRGPLRPAVRGSWLLAVAGVCTWLLGEAIRQHDPIWRIAGGLLMAGCTLLSVAWLLRVGGSALLRREVAPLVFAWTALPWPMPLELALTQRLLHFVTSIAVFCATAVGVPVLQRGNTIEMVTGFVGVDEACSGVQSAHAALMAALFFAAFYRLGALRGLALVAAGGAVAVLGNLLRVLALVWVVAGSGPAGAERWHDTIGTVSTIAIFAGLFGIAVALRPREVRLAAADLPTQWPKPAGSIAMLAVMGAAAFSPVLKGARPAGTSAQQLKIDVRQLPSGWKAEGFAATRAERALLRFAERDGWRLTVPSGRVMWLYHFTWSGDGMPPFAFSHTPAMCMPWKGWAPIGAPQRAEIPFRGASLPAMIFMFEQGRERVAAAQIVFAGGKARHFTDFDPFGDNRVRRLFAAWNAPHEHIDEEVLFYIPGTANPAAVIEAASRVLDAVAR